MTPKTIQFDLEKDVKVGYATRRGSTYVDNFENFITKNKNEHNRRISNVVMDEEEREKHLKQIQKSKKML